MANLTNEKAEFAIAIFRHFSPFFAIGPPGQLFMKGLKFASSKKERLRTQTEIYMDSSLLRKSHI